MTGETHETVTIDLTPDDRLTLYAKIMSRMKELGHNPCDYGSLDLGFELPAAWPHDKDCLPTLTQLVMVAVKLRMKIIISRLYIEPLRKNETDSEGS